MREGRESGTDDENHVPQKHRKRRSIWKIQNVEKTKIAS